MPVLDAIKRTLERYRSLLKGDKLVELESTKDELLKKLLEQYKKDKKLLVSEKEKDFSKFNDEYNDYISTAKDKNKKTITSFNSRVKKLKDKALDDIDTYFTSDISGVQLNDEIAEANRLAKEWTRNNPNSDPSKNQSLHLYKKLTKVKQDIRKAMLEKGTVIGNPSLDAINKKLDNKLSKAKSTAENDRNVKKLERLKRLENDLEDLETKYKENTNATKKDHDDQIASENTKVNLTRGGTLFTAGLGLGAAGKSLYNNLWGDE